MRAAHSGTRQCGDPTALTELSTVLARPPHRAQAPHVITKLQCIHAPQLQRTQRVSGAVASTARHCNKTPTRKNAPHVASAPRKLPTTLRTDGAGAPRAKQMAENRAVCERAYETSGYQRLTSHAHEVPEAPREAGAGGISGGRDGEALRLPEGNNRGPPHPLSTTVAPFRAWRGSRCAVGGPGATVAHPAVGFQLFRTRRARVRHDLRRRLTDGPWSLAQGCHDFPSAPFGE